MRSPFLFSKCRNFKETAKIEDCNDLKERKTHYHGQEDSSIGNVLAFLGAGSSQRCESVIPMLGRHKQVTLWGSKTS